VVRMVHGRRRYETPSATRKIGWGAILPCALRHHHFEASLKAEKQ
jgi:hypothetical protein